MRRLVRLSLLALPLPFAALPILAVTLVGGGGSEPGTTTMVEISEPLPDQSVWWPDGLEFTEPAQAQVTYAPDTADCLVPGCTCDSLSGISLNGG
ncbi:MAG: hypothetical protein WEC33_03640 [Dehalococcoidia bacterium]